MKCAICGKEIKGFSNNAEPLTKEAVCNDCNCNYVIPARTLLVKWDEMDNEQKLTNKQILVHQNKQRLKVGAKVLILEMQNESQYNGKFGIVEHIDDIGQIHGTWGGCALIPNTDIYYIFDK